MTRLDNRKKVIEANRKRVAMEGQQIVEQYLADPELVAKGRLLRKPQSESNQDSDSELHEFRARVLLDKPKFTNRVALQCECGASACTATVHVPEAQFDTYHQHAGAFLCVEGHDHEELDRALKPIRDPDADYVEAQMRQGWDLPVDQNALNADLESLKSQVSEIRVSLEAALTRISGAVALGTGVLGVFTALRPNLVKTTPSDAILLTLVPYIALIATSVYWTWRIRSRLLMQDYPGRYAKSRAAMANRAIEREAKRYELHIDWNQPPPLPGITYEALDIRDAAMKSAGLAWHASLPLPAWLAFEWRIQMQKLIDSLDLRDRARYYEALSVGFLALLLANLVALSVHAW